ncbi:hypothetical protein BG004_004249, partial [Podila humilis]
LLAIVNRSDFAMNVPGIDLAKSTALIVSLDENLTVREKVEMFVQEANKRRLKDKDPATAEQFRISARIFHDIQNTPMGVRQQIASDTSDFLERVQYLQHLKDQHLCTHATLYFKSKTLALYPDLCDHQRRKEAFGPILKGQDFFRMLAVALYAPGRTNQRAVKEGSLLAREIAGDFQKDFAIPLRPVLARLRGLLDGMADMAVIEAIARRASDGVVLMLTIISRLSSLGYALFYVLAHALTWSNSIGKEMLDSISDNGDSKRDDIISLNWFLNAVLPEESRISLLPQSGWGDAFFCITETYLLGALQRKRPETEKGYLLPVYKHLFGSAGSYAAHRGQLTYDLFFRSTGTN